jgi:ATP-dependent helicase/nuclease subunit B
MRRHFLSWDHPWLPQAAAWLAGGWHGAGPLDLSRVLAVVPTRQAGRRLREALAEHAAAHGTAVFPPCTMTPDTMLAAGAAAPDVASRLECLLAWAEVFRTEDLAGLPDVFPVAPPRRDSAWAGRLAEVFFRLQTQLAEGGVGFAEVAARAGPGQPEADRWRQLAALERRQRERLAAAGRREPHAARRSWAQTAPPPGATDRIVVLAVPDPLPLAAGVLERWAEVVPVDVVIFAPEAEQEAFDAMGRPGEAAWGRREIELPDFERRVQLCTDPAATAERVVDLVKQYSQPDGWVAIGLADAEVRPLLEHALARAEVASFNPEGRAQRAEGLYALLAALAALAKEAGSDPVAALARCPDFLAALKVRLGAGGSVAGFLAELDEVRAEFLPPDLTELRRVTGAKRRSLAVGLDFIAELRESMRQGGFPEGVARALREIFRAVRLDLEVPAQARVAAALTAWHETMQECAEAAERFPGWSADEWWEMALRTFGERRRPEDKPAGALELQGWLELPWEDAPHLVVAGLNEGVVPEAVVGDAFLPESLRLELGLKSNAARLARDAYLLQAIAASRQRSGRLDLLYAKVSATGEPQRPSRLLLRGPEVELPRRIALLFRPAEAARPSPPWTRAWQLTPRREAAPQRVAVTGMRAWLACPFRFYLQHVLKLSPVDAAKSELDARDFGTLCHGALEAMAREPALRACGDERQLRDFLLGELERQAHARFGLNRSLPLVVQLESARQRLARAAAVQAREWAEGWIIERSEWPFVLDLGGLEVRGRIDRIDRHAATGARRVLDYKTSDLAVPPARSHLRPRRPDDASLPAWRGVTLGGREYVWADLQLPLYLRALGAEADARSLVSGYFNLPKAVGETAVALWPDLTGDLLAAAAACTDGVAAAIRAGEFWPPAELPGEGDTFGALFHHGAAASVAGEVAQ